jgi:hypothetical protein
MKRLLYTSAQHNPERSFAGPGGIQELRISMSQKDKTSVEQKNAAESRLPAKRPYHKPEFRFERVFETMALACAKTGTQGGCSIIKKRS